MLRGCILILLVLILDTGKSVMGGELKHGQQSASSRQSQTSCLDNLKNYFEDQSEDGLFLRNRAKDCKGRVSRKSQFKSAGELREFLESQKSLALGRINSQRLAQCTRHDDHETVAFYYYSLNKFQGASESAIEQVGAIDYLLGGSEPLYGVSCSEAQMTRLANRCQQIRECSAPKKKSEETALHEAAVKTAEAERTLRHLDRIISQLASRKNAPRAIIDGREMDRAEMQRLHRELVARRPAIRASYVAMYPWLDGDIYKKKRDPSRPKSNLSVEQAIRAQLEENRKAYLEEFRKLQDAAKCFNGVAQSSDKSCSINQVKKILRRAPPLSYSIARNQGKVGDAGVADQYMDFAVCFDEATEDFEATKKVVNDLAMQSGLSVGTLFLAPVALGSRALSTITKLPTKEARIASAAALGSGYTLVLAPHVAEAHEVCSQEAQEYEVALKRPRVPADYCPGAKTDLQNSHTRLNECLLASLTLGFDVLATVPGVRALAKNITGADRVLRAEELLKRKLSDKEKAALLRAHSVGSGEIGDDGKNLAGLGNYTSLQKREKIRILRENGFSKDEAKKLLDEGVAGETLRAATPAQIQQEKMLNRAKEYRLHGDKFASSNPPNGYNAKAVKKIAGSSYRLEGETYLSVGDVTKAEEAFKRANYQYSQLSPGDLSPIEISDVRKAAIMAKDSEDIIKTITKEEANTYLKALSNELEAYADMPSSPSVKYSRGAYSGAIMNVINHFDIETPEAQKIYERASKIFDASR